MPPRCMCTLYMGGVVSAKLGGSDVSLEVRAGYAVEWHRRHHRDPSFLR